MSETIYGISVIKAFEAEQMFKNINLEYVNRNHRGQFNMDHLQLWLAFRLEFAASLLVLATSLFCVGLRDSVPASATGLAISNTIQILIFFTLAVRGWAGT